MKTAPNSFVGTRLGELVDAAGFMTHSCVTFTAQAAAEQHRAALATIGDLYAVVVPSSAELG
ncbi:hypothetical protein [Amycolatopsis sp. cmx-11-32]|uniref:hypothetical protein n=1 Tax=Amycolatopsis sp. cmx-11-32 TaxID=2785796 RepID=UPI0039E24F4A